MALKVKINTGAWYGDGEMTLTFPDNWDVSVRESKRVEALDEAEIAGAFAEPIGKERIRQLARGKGSAVIIVDDLSRPTPSYLVIPNIVEELREAGISAESIRIVIGGGSHRPLTKEEMEKKVGVDIASEYDISNHNAFSKTLKDLGHLEDGTPVHINEVVANSDVKIAIGGIIPHGSVGFGGGAKMILPGVSGYHTIAHNHQGKYKSRGRGNLEGQSEERDIRDNAEDVARHLGLDFTVNIVLTRKREVAGLFMGDAAESYRQGAVFARQIYGTPISKEEVEAADIVIINAYPQDSDPVQMGKSMWPSGVFKKAQKVMINPASDGIEYHGLGDKMDYETYLGKKADEKIESTKDGGIKSKDDFALLTSNFPKSKFYKSYPSGAMFESWEELVSQLESLHNKPKVVVIPYSPIQLPQII